MISQEFDDLDCCACSYGVTCSECLAVYQRDLEFEKRWESEHKWVQEQNRIDPSNTIFDQPVEPSILEEPTSKKKPRNKKVEKIQKKEKRERLVEAQMLLTTYPFYKNVHDEHDLVTLWGLVTICRDNWEAISTIMGSLNPPNFKNQITFEDLKEAWHERTVKQVQEE